MDDSKKNPEIKNDNLIKIGGPEFLEAMRPMYESMVDEILHTEIQTKERVGLDQALDRLSEIKVINEIVPPVDIEDGDTPETIMQKEHAHLAAMQDQWDREEKQALRQTPSFKRAQEIKNESLWQQLEGTTVRIAIQEWIESIKNPRTKRAYRISMQELCKKMLIKPSMNLQAFSMRNHDVTLDEIKTNRLFSEVKKGSTISLRPWSEATRQQRAAAFASFTRFLSRRTGGIVRRASPTKEGDGTFYRIRDKVKTNAFQDRRDWSRFLKELQKINPRDCLIAKIMLQGGKRISEALSLDISMIDFESGQISFIQSKTKGTAKETVITYRQEIMAELKEYIAGRSGLAFITESGKKVSPQQLERNFRKAGDRAGITFKVTPHVLRATAVTYFKMEGFSDSDIMKVTGHASSEMIGMYDKSSAADNASKKINLV